MKISLTVLFPLLIFLFSLKKKKERRRRKRIVSLSPELNRSIKKKSSRIAQQITGSQRRPIPNRKSLLVSARYHPFSPSYTTNTKRSYYYTTNVPRFSIVEAAIFARAVQRNNFPRCRKRSSGRLSSDIHPLSRDTWLAPLVRLIN